MRTPSILALVGLSLLVPSLAFAEEKAEATPSGTAKVPEFRLGALVGGGAPSLVTGELVLQYKSYLAFGLDYGTTPALHLPLAAGAKVDASAFSFSTRVRPFKGDLFLGLGLGSQRFNGSFTDPTGGPNADAFTSTIFIMPQLGFMHRFQSGLAFGSDIGVELPISSRMTESPLPPPVHDATASFMKTPIPVVNLLRVGYVL